MTFTTTGSTGAWVQEGADGENFHRLTVTIEDGQAINIAVAASSEQGRGFLNMIQIAPVPEPSSALLALAAALPLFCRRRRTV